MVTAKLYQMWPGRRFGLSARCFWCCWFAFTWPAPWSCPWFPPPDPASTGWRGCRCAGWTLRRSVSVKRNRVRRNSRGCRYLHPGVLISGHLEECDDVGPSHLYAFPAWHIDAYVVVAQHTGDRLDVHTVLEGQCGEGVPLLHKRTNRKTIALQQVDGLPLFFFH